MNKIIKRVRLLTITNGGEYFQLVEQNKMQIFIYEITSYDVFVISFYFRPNIVYGRNNLNSRSVNILISKFSQHASRDERPRALCTHTVHYTYSFYTFSWMVVNDLISYAFEVFRKCINTIKFRRVYA